MLLNTLPSRTKSLEQVKSPITVEYCFNDQIVVVTAKDTHRETVDAWFDIMVSIGAAWPKDKPLYVLLDFSAKDCTVTPYARARNEALRKVDFGLTVYTALILASTMAIYLSTIFVRAMGQSDKVYFSRSRADALQHLQAQIIGQQR